ncbi:hypothetical protein JHK82_048208 [Glycine max]|nr:hypothetical protein JHK82_048208 [Glycine max]
MYEEGVVITLKHRHYRINRPTELIARQILKKLGQYPITIRGLNYGHVKQMQGQVFHSIWADMVEEQIHWGYHIQSTICLVDSLFNKKVNFGEDKRMKKEITKGRSVGNNNILDRMNAAKQAWSLCKSKKCAFITWPTLCRLDNPFHQIPWSNPN